MESTLDSSSPPSAEAAFARGTISEPDVLPADERKAENQVKEGDGKATKQAKAAHRLYLADAVVGGKRVNVGVFDDKDKAAAAVAAVADEATPAEVGALVRELGGNPAAVAAVRGADVEDQYWDRLGWRSTAEEIEAQRKRSEIEAAKRERLQYRLPPTASNAQLEAAKRERKAKEEMEAEAAMAAGMPDVGWAADRSTPHSTDNLVGMSDKKLMATLNAMMGGGSGRGKTKRRRNKTRRRRKDKRQKRKQSRKPTKRRRRKPTKRN